MKRLIFIFFLFLLAYSQALISKTNDYICKDGLLHYTYIVMTSVSGHEYTEKRKVSAQLVASIEDMSNDESMLQFRIIKAAFNGQIAHASKYPMYFDQFPYKPGQTFWDKSDTWYSCSQN